MKIIFIRKKILYFLIGIILFTTISGIILYRKFRVKEVSFLPITNKIIGIDPGHGGVDPGAVSRNDVEEDDINLKIALKLKRYIEQSGGIPVMTRTTDTGLYTEKSKTLREMKTEDLINRKKLVEQADCELFVSIHMNSSTSSRYSGAQTFYMKDSDEGYKLACLIQDEFRKILDKENKRAPAYTEDIYLLKDMKMPSVLVEAGFLSNIREEILLLKDEYQEKVAWSIYVGIMKYLNLD